MQCGLLGQKLSHSYSPQIHKHLGDYDYRMYEIAPEALDGFLRSNDFDALNVTIPYKKSVIPYCSRLSPIAQKLGAVNTIVRQPDGSLLGHNSDYYGFESMLYRSGVNVRNKKALVLGSGGASATVCAVLKELGAMVVVISRSGPDNYSNLSKHIDTALIVNTTPVGMYPHNDSSPVDLDLFPNLEGVLDLIYNPCRTRLLSQAQGKGLVAENGLWMLVAQAKESAQWFTGKSIPDDLIPSIHRTLSKQMSNVILIGMPGSGKSTVGKILAAKLGKDFVDADDMIVQHSGMSIPDIFHKYGEEGFRKIETEVLSQLGKRSGCVIATGGGCVTIPENYSLLHQNGVIVCLERDISKLPTHGRPLSMSNSLEEMYRKRKPLYEAFADHIVSNEEIIDQTIQSILSLEDIL